MIKHAHKVGLFGTAFALIAISGSTVVALPPRANAHAQATTTSTDQSSDSGSQGADKAAAHKLKVCQNRQNAVDNILSRIVTRGTNQLNLFNTIAQRVETFKTNKNLTVANYDQLVAKLQADQAKATNDLANMKANDTIDCNSSDPKAMVTAFQSDLKTEISDLKTYKTDVKNLIVAVKTAAGSSSSDNAGGTQ